MEKSEWVSLIIAIVLMSLLISFNNNTFSESKIASALLISIIVISLAVYTKKITAHKIDTKITIKNWEFQRYWIGTRSHLKKPFPIGIFLPLLLGFVSGGLVKFLAFLQFKLEALPAKAVKKYGQRRFSDAMEWDDALVVFYSLCPLLVLSIISAFLSSSSLFFMDLAKYSLYYSIYNLIPFGLLDGNKLFFGSRPLYVFSLILTVCTALIVFF
jgi:hypothetical protein